MGYLKAALRRWMGPPPLEIEPMADNDHQRIATNIRKIAQRVAGGDYAGVALVYIGEGGEPVTMAKSRGSGPSNSLIGGLAGLAQDEHLRQSAIETRDRLRALKAKAAPAIIKPSPAAVREIKRGRGRN